VDAAEWDRWVEYLGPLCCFGVKNFGVKAFHRPVTQRYMSGVYYLNTGTAWVCFFLVVNESLEQAANQKD
jgi:hypothetical protein